MHTASRLALALCATAVLASCASASKAKEQEAIPLPDTPTPRLDFLWHDQLGSWKFLGVEPKEFATPTHVGATDELVVATAQGEVVKFQAANGDVLWDRWFKGVFHAGAVVGPTRVYLADLDGHLRALDLGTGKEVWHRNVENSIESRGTYSRGRLFWSDDADVLHAYDAKTGKQLWSYSRELPEYFTIKGSCTPVVDGDAVYCGFSDGHLVALQIDTGSLIWDADLTGGKTDFVDVDGKPILKGKTLYAASYAGGVYAIEKKNGGIVWRTEVGSVTDLIQQGTRLYASSAAGRVVALDAENGLAQWGFKAKDSIPGSLVAFGPYVLALTTDGPLYVLDGDTGFPLLKWHGTTGFFAPVESGASRLYALTNYGDVLALALGY